jgi:hypothetical protein
MSRTACFVLLITLTFGFASPLARADGSDPAAQSAVLPSPAESGMPEKIARKEVRRIRREFTDLLDQERDRLRNEQSRRRREGDASRKTRRRDWDAREKTARRKFFDENSHGPERRNYVKDFNDRRKAFYDDLRNEEKSERNELDVRWKALKESQRTRLDTVETYLRRSERPTTKLLERAD